ncbi:SigE family RNA polymerase sigma factor [Streptomyces kaniharaensis]|uniref:SigE family RNA polymerase sigma factor n=1 Tax=Streptomyces kaniharaensis TaxID=212423 RepID=A0A6N7KP44_9ACTN|nr:SigE family RNA polymerase sigma factor [Streptomyces kaniharaensis]MQS13286.1 SigE family RNA polymerase sigma factor [Streptomyces kaniharaensis]
MTGGWATFEEFAATCGPRLLRSAWRLTGDQYLAEDLLQTALARTWPKWSRIAVEQPEAYVRRTMVNIHVNWWRRSWRRELPHAKVPDPPAAPDRYSEVDGELELALLLRHLPKRQRAVVVLRYLEDLSVEETAAILACSTGTVKSQAFRALRTLRDRLPDHALAAHTAGR